MDARTGRMYRELRREGSGAREALTYARDAAWWGDNGWDYSEHAGMWFLVQAEWDDISNDDEPWSLEDAHHYASRYRGMARDAAYRWARTAVEESLTRCREHLQAVVCVYAYRTEDDANDAYKTGQLRSRAIDWRCLGGIGADIDHGGIRDDAWLGESARDLIDELIAERDERRARFLALPDWVREYMAIRGMVPVELMDTELEVIDA